MTYLLLILSGLLWADDAILIMGQSNAATTYQTYSFSSDSINSLAKSAVDSGTMVAGDTAYGTATGQPAQYARGIGAWGMRLAQRIKQAANCSLYVINGALGSTTMLQHLPSRSLNTYYGRAYWRMDRAGKRSNVKFIYWWQGEAEDSASSLLYLARFTSLDSAWRVDYPNLRQIFVIRPRLCTGLSQDTNILAVINSLPTHFDSLTVVSVDNISGWDGCHWSLAGYTTIGDTLYNALRRVSSYPTQVDPAVAPIPTFMRLRSFRAWIFNYDVNGRIVPSGPYPFPSGIYFGGKKSVRVR